MQIKQVLAILNKDVQLPANITETLQRWRDVYYGISLHTTGACPRFQDQSTGRMVKPAGYYGEAYQYLFDNFLLSRHPREDSATRNWRYSQYRPMTKAPFGQITEVVTGAVFQSSNYTVQLTDEADDAYIHNNNFSGQNIIEYFSNVGYKNMIEDPNGVFLRIPKQPFYEQDTDKVAVDIWFVHSKDMVWLTDTDLVFTRGDFAYWVNAQTVWRFAYNTQQRKYYLAKEDAQGYYAHMLGRLPITVAGGEWNTQGYYDSFYSKAKAAADDFVSAYSAAQLVDKEASHPYIVEAAADCVECSGHGQVQVDCDSCPNGVELVRCTVCGGSGQVSHNPGQHIVIPHEQMKDGTPIQIVNPDVAINTHHRDVCQQVMQLIIEALHLQKTDAAQSGVAKAIDQERLYKFISAISNHLFDNIITDTLRDIIAYRNIEQQNGFRILKPTQFNIKTSADLLAEYNEGAKANLPTFIRKRMAMDYVQKQYSSDELMKRKAQLITELDELSILSTTEIVDLQATGIISDAQLYYSRNLPVAIDELIAEKGEYWFITTVLKDIKAALPALGDEALYRVGLN